MSTTDTVCKHCGAEVVWRHDSTTGYKWRLYNASKELNERHKCEGFRQAAVTYSKQKKLEREDQEVITYLRRIRRIYANRKASALIINIDKENLSITVKLDEQ